jgi:predicted small lipoprotein YifL
LGPYSFAFKVLASADIRVYVGSTLKTVTTHYTTSLNADGTGSVTFTSGNAPASDTIVTIESNQAIERTSDYTTGGDFKAASLNDDLDSLAINDQQLETVLSRNVQLSTTVNRTTSGSGTSGPLYFPYDDIVANNASKVVSFDAAGTALIATQELGEFQGNWAASTAYIVRDLVKDTSNGNIYMVNTAHTSSGSQPISSNTDVAKWSLIVDAASATTSQTAAATSAQLADDWAVKTSGVVESSEFSSKAYAVGGTGVTTSSGKGAAKEWATTTSGAVDTSEYSAKSYALGGTGVTTTSGKGAAKEWATTTGGAVDTSEYSAKEYAIGTTVAVGSAKDWALQAEDSAVTGSSYSALHHAAKGAASATAAASSATGAASSASTATTQATAAAASATAAAASDTAAANSVSAVGLQFTFDNSTTMADPGTGDFRLNHGTVASVTAIAFDATSADTGNPDVSDFITTWDDSTSTLNGHLIIKKKGTPATFAIYTVGAVTDNTGWLQVALTHVDSNGSWSAADVGYLQFIRLGDKGDTGSTGSTGATGNSAGLLMAFESATSDSDQGAGKVWLNNSAASATVLYMDDLEAGGASINALVDTWDDSTTTALRGTISIYKNSAPENFHIFTVSGVVTSASTYSKIACTFVQTSGTISDGDAVSVQFQRSGDIGATGPGSGDLLAANNLSDVSNAATSFGNLKQAASTTATGVAEIATTAETVTGTDTGRVVTPAGLHGALAGLTDTTVTASDTFVFADATDSNALKEDTVQGIIDLVPDATTIVTGVVERSTSAENVTGTSDTVYPTVAGTKEMIDTHVSSAQLGFSNVSGWADSAVETVSLSTAAAAIAKAQVAVWEEIPDANKTNADWDIATDDTGFNLIDSAYSQTLTPAATTGASIAFTMGGGTFATADIGKLISNVSTAEAGKARIISIASNVATCTITTTFTNTDAIASGDWEMYAGEFVDGAFAISNASTTGGGLLLTAVNEVRPSGSGEVSDIVRVSDTTAIVVSGSGGTIGQARHVTVDSGGGLTFGTEFNFSASLTTSVLKICKMSATTFVVVYKNAGTYEGQLFVMSLSGTTLSKGTEINFYGASSGAYRMGVCSIVSLSATVGIICNRNDWSGEFTSHVFTVSGTSISVGTAELIGSDSAYFSSMVKLTSTTAMVCWGNDYDMKATILTVSGTSVSEGAIADILTGTASHIRLNLISATQAVVTWINAGAAAGDAYAAVLTESGGAVTAGTGVALDTSNCDWSDSLLYTATSGAMIYQDMDATPDMLLYCPFTVSGTTITAGTPAQYSPIYVENFSVHVAQLTSTTALHVAHDILAGNRTTVGFIDIDSLYESTAADQVFTSGRAQNMSCAAISETRLISVCRDWGVSNYGRARIHDITAGSLLEGGGIMSMGTAVTFESAAVEDCVVSVIDATKAIVVYKDTGAFNVLTGAVLTLSGTSITAETPVEISGAHCTGMKNLVQLSSTAFCLAFVDSAQCKAIAFTVSGTSFSAGSPVTIETDAVAEDVETLFLSSTQAICCFRNGSDAQAQVSVLDISGTTITANTPVSLGACDNNDISGDRVSASQVVFSFTNSNITKIAVVNISGSTATPVAAVTVDSGPADKHNLTMLTATDGFLVGQAENISVSGCELNFTHFTLTGSTIAQVAFSVMRDVASEHINTCRMSDNRMAVIRGTSSPAEGILGWVDLSSSPLYVVNQHICTITGTDSVDTTFYSDLNAVTATETLNGETANYAFSVNPTPASAEVTGGTFFVVGSGETATRNIASTLNAVHGGTAGVWYINTNVTYGSQTWAAATTNEAKAAIEEAEAVAANNMSGTAVNAVADANWAAFGTSFAVAITLKTTDSGATPTVDGISFNYDADVINRLETDAYTVEMPAAGTVKVTAPSSGGPRNARIYVSG